MELGLQLLEQWLVLVVEVGVLILQVVLMVG